MNIGAKEARILAESKLKDMDSSVKMLVEFKINDAINRGEFKVSIEGLLNDRIIDWLDEAGYKSAYYGNNTVIQW